MFEYEDGNGVVSQWTKKDIDDAARVKGLTTEQYLSKNPKVKFIKSETKPIKVEKTEPIDAGKTNDVADQDAPVTSTKTTASESGDSTSVTTLPELPSLLDLSTSYDFKPYELLEPTVQDQTAIENVSTDLANLQNHEEQKEEALEAYKEKDKLAEDKPVLSVESITEQREVKIISKGIDKVVDDVLGDNTTFQNINRKTIYNKDEDEVVYSYIDSDNPVSEEDVDIFEANLYKSKIQQKALELSEGRLLTEEEKKAIEENPQAFVNDFDASLAVINNMYDGYEVDATLLQEDRVDIRLLNEFNIAAGRDVYDVEESDVDVNEFINKKQQNQTDAHKDWSATYNVEFNKRFNQQYKNDITALNEDVQKKYSDLMNIELSAYQEDLLLDFQQRQANGEFEGMTQENVQQLFVGEVNKKQTELADIYNPQANAELNKYVSARYDDFTVANEKDFQQKQIEFFENYLPPTDLIGRQKYDDLTKQFRINGWDSATDDTKKLILDNAWTNIEIGLKQGGSLTDQQILDRKTEYYHKFWKDMIFDIGGEMTRFGIDETATDVLDAINIELEKVQPIIDARVHGEPSMLGELGGEYGIYTKEQYDQAASDYHKLQQAKEKLEVAIDRPEEISKSGGSKFFQGLFGLDSGLDYIPIVGGIVGTAQAVDAYRIFKKQEAGKDLTPAEQLLVNSLAVRSLSDAKFAELTKGETAYNSGKMIGEMLPWLAEIAFTGGVFTATKKVTRDILEKVVMRNLDDMFTEAGKRTLKGNAVDAVAMVLAAGAQSAAIPTSYLEGTFERMTPQAKLMLTEGGDDLMNQLALNGGFDIENGAEEFDKAFAKAFGVNFLEYFTERLGAGFPKLGKFIKTDVMKDPDWMRKLIFSRYLNKLGLTNTGAMMKALGKNVSYDGMLGEIAEEIINLPLQNLVEGNSPLEGLDENFLKEMGLTMGVMQVAFSAPGTVSKIIKGKHNSILRMDGENFSTIQELQEEYNRRKAKGENPLVYIKNDGNGAQIIAKRMLELDGNIDALQWESTRMTFTDNKTAQEVKAIESLDKESREKVETLEEKIEELEDEKADLQESSMVNVNEKINTKDKIDKKLAELENERQQILEPIIKSQAKEQSKVTISTIEDLAESLFGEQLEVKEVTNGTLIQIFGKDADGSFGSIKENDDGSRTIYINANKKTTREGVNVAAHEFLHGILQTTLRNNPSTSYALGNAMLNMLGDIMPFITKDNTRFINRLNQYRDPNSDEMIPLTSAKQAEEVLTLVADAIATGQMTYNKNNFEKLGAMFRRVFKNYGIPYTFKSGMDVFNFLEDYSRGIEKGTLSEAMRVGAVDGFRIADEVQEIDDVYREMIKGVEEETEQQSKDASDAVQQAYETQGVDGAYEIFQLFKPITNRIANKYREVPGFDLELMISEIEIGNRGMYDLIRDYNPNSGVPLAAYINTYLPSRSIEAANRILKEQFEEDVTEAKGVAAEEVIIQAPQRKTKLINVAERLGVSKEVLAEIEAAGIDPKTILSFKKVPNAALQTISKLTGIPVKKLKNQANLSKGELATMQMFIRKNVGLLIDMLPQGFDSEGKATGVPKTILEAFYNKRSSRAKTKAGLNTQVKKTNIKDNEFLEIFGIVDGIPDRTDRNTSARALSMANLIGKIMTNQALRQIDPLAAQVANGMSDVLFSKDVSDAITYMEPSWPKIISGMGGVPLDISGKDRGAYVNWLATVAAKRFPKSFFTSGNFFASGAKNDNITDSQGRQLYIGTNGNITINKTEKVDDLEIALDKLKEYTLLDGNKVRNDNPNFKSYELSLMPASPKYAFANRAQVDAALEGVEFAPESSNIKATAKVSKKYGTLSAEQAQDWLENNQDVLDQSSEGFKEIWSILQDMMQDPSNIAFVGALLESSARNQGHFMRTGARYGFHNTMGLKNVEEHTQPATEFAKMLFTLSKMGVVDQYIDNAMKAYIQGALPKIYDNLLKKVGEFNYVSQIPKEWQFKVFTGEVPVWIRYFNPNVNNNDGGINPNFIVLANGKTVAQEYGLGIDSSLYDNTNVVSLQQDLLFEIFSGQTTLETAKNRLNKYIAGVAIQKAIKPSKKIISKAVEAGRVLSSKDVDPKGITVLDFDDTLATTKSLVRYTAPDGTTGTLNAEEYATRYQDLLGQGYEFDFSEFDKVVNGKIAPLFQKALKLQGKFGPENMFVLTARNPQAAEAIFDFLKANGLNIPFKNITGLGNSTSEAKALWMAEKVGEGYNDFYFADDALQNVQAVKNTLDQLDVKGKVQQAKIQFSKDFDPKFNEMLERTKGIGAEKVFSRVGAQKRGKNVGRFTFFVPPSADDFVGLLRYFVGKGAQGNADIAFFNEALIKPFARADEEMKRQRQTITDDYKALRKKFPQVKKKLGKMIGDSGFTYDNAIRTYLWNKAGFEIPGLSKRDIKLLTDTVAKDSDLRAFADTIGLISKQTEGYVKPGEYWNTESIASDLQNVVNKVGRKKYLAEWIENKNIIFSEDNLNKIEAVYGSNFREALENSLWRMENGTNRSKGMGRIEGAWNNWVNNSVGAIMFFNARSAVLQTLSTVNFINFEDNNMFAAAKAFANQKQYWSDFVFLFNSDFLKQRRAGLSINVNEAELASAVAGATNKAKAALQYLLKIGFLPTQIADSFAIAAGGGTYYRNRIKRYVAEGMDQKAAEEQAMIDFMEIAEETQQSARPDRISQQQASSLGRIILAFANTPMQYNRLIKKAAGDLINKRGDWRSNISRIVYYGAIQNIIFSGLQSAIFALAFDDDDDDEQLNKKSERMLNGMIDSLLRGSGLAGAVVATLKNTILKFMSESDKGWNADYGNVIVQALNVSPPLGSKVRKLYNSTKTYKFNREVMGEMETLDLENPIWDIVGNVVEATTNLPLNRGFRKIDNLKEMLNQDNETWQRIFVGLGWDQWSLNIDTRKEVDEVKEVIKEKKKEEKKIENAIKKEKKKKEVEKANEAIIKKNKEKQKKEGEDATCAAVSSKGNRCKRKPINDGFCTIHEKVKQNDTGKKTQCSKIKSDGVRCKVETASKSKLCYYHD